MSDEKIDISSVIENTRELFPPEVEEGNKEYKRQLYHKKKSKNRYREEELTSQMKWRLGEGGGVAFYYIGIDDNGSVFGIKPDDIDKNIKVIQKMAKKVNAEIYDYQKGIHQNKYYLIVEIHSKLANHKKEFKVICLGSGNVGKSSLLSAILNDDLDDGKGRARIAVFKHKHELFSGQTSSIALESFGYTEDKIYNYNNCSDIQEICQDSKHLVTILDVPGHPKYYKTTYNCLSGYNPNALLVVVDKPQDDKCTDNVGEYLLYSKLMNIPLIIAISKIDLHTPEYLKEITDSYQKYQDRYQTIILPFSNVSGENLDTLRDTLIELANKYYNNIGSYKDDTTLREFQVMDTYQIPDVGLILQGLVTRGKISNGEQLYVSFPEEFWEENKVIEDTSFYQDKVKVVGIHYKMFPHDELFESQIGSIKIITNPKMQRKISKHKKIILSNYKKKLSNKIEIMVAKTKNCSFLVNNHYTLFTKNIVQTYLVEKIIKNKKNLVLTLISVNPEKPHPLDIGDKITIKGINVFTYGSIINLFNL